MLAFHLLALLFAAVAAWTVGPSSSLAQAPSSKILLVTFLFSKGSVKPEDAILAYGSSRMPKTSPKEKRDFWVSLVDAKGHELNSYGIPDPRKQHLDEGEALTSEKPIEVVVEGASHTVRLPFDPKVREIRVLKDMTIIARVELTPLIQKFCAKHEEDKDCRFIANQSP